MEEDGEEDYETEGEVRGGTACAEGDAISERVDDEA